MGSSKQQTNSNASYNNTNSIDPVYNALQMANYGDLQNWAANYQPVSIPTPLAYNQDQLNSQQMIRNLGDPTAAYNQQQAAAQGRISDLMNYKPLNVTAPVIDPNAVASYFTNVGAAAGAPTASAASYTAALAKAAQIDPNSIAQVSTQMTPQMIQQYLDQMDPSIQKNLLDVTNKALTQQQLMAQQPNATAAAKAGAFGGSRQGVLEANTNLAYAQAAAQADANIAQHGYDTALTAAQTDLARKLQTDLANQGVQVDIAKTNADLLQQINIANQNATNTASQTGAQNQNAVNIANASNATQANIANAQAAQQMALARANAAYQSLVANANNNLSAQQLNQQGGLQAANLGLSSANTLFGNAQGLYNNAITNANNLGQVGAQNYALSAAQQQVAYQNAVQQANATPYKVGVLGDYLHNMPYGTNQTGSSSSQQTTVSTPSLMSTIGQGLGLGAGLLGAGMGIGGLTGLLGGGGTATPQFNAGAGPGYGYGPIKPGTVG